jgi:hypothetical protein
MESVSSLEVIPERLAFGVVLISYMRLECRDTTAPFAA